MTGRLLRTVILVFAIDASLLLIVGVMMWDDAPSPAEEAVGKALVTLGVAVALPVFVAFLLWLETRQLGEKEPAPARNDWDDV